MDLSKYGCTGCVLGGADRHGGASATNRNPPKPCTPAARWNGLPSRKNRAAPQCRLRRRLPFAATSGRGPDNKARRGRGTEGSNLSPSSGESGANLIFRGESHRWRRGFRQGCSFPGSVTSSATTHPVGAVVKFVVNTVGENAPPVPVKSGRSPSLIVRWISAFGPGSTKAQHDPLIVPGKRQA
jgi:hypothetical protein